MGRWVGSAARLQAWQLGSVQAWWKEDWALRPCVPRRPSAQLVRPAQPRPAPLPTCGRLQQRVVPSLQRLDDLAHKRELHAIGLVREEDVAAADLVLHGCWVPLGQAGELGPWWCLACAALS